MSKTLKPNDFDKHPVHFLELDYLNNERFEFFAARHIMLLRYSYTVSEGKPNQVISLGDGSVERIYVPFDDESNQEFFDRVRTSVQNLKVTHLFYHNVTPMIRTSPDGTSETIDTMCWYAHLPGQHALGSMDLIEREGELRTLGDNRPADPDTFSGWLAEQLHSFL